jgi:hypothetical protein
VSVNLILSVIVILLSTIGTSDLSAARLPSVAAIAARHVAALGGRNRIDAIKTISFEGAWVEGGQSLPMSARRMRPFYFLVAPKVDPAYDEGYDGSSWEYYGEYGVALRTAGTPGDATRRGSEFDDPLVDYVSTGKRLAIVGTTSIGGAPAYDILVTLADGFQKHVYVDAANSLIVGTRQVAKVHAFGPGITTQELVSDYRRIDGVLFSMTSKDVDLHTGREIDRLTWRSIAVNGDIPLTTFSPPKSANSMPLARFLERLYEERANAPACEAAYREYRSHAGGAGSKTEDGVEFIGYQMLKAGAVAAPIALLKANAADFPHSAAAQFGLGRGYQTAGEMSRARAAYRRALQLSPRYKRASQALKELGP